MARTLARIDAETLVFGQPSPSDAQLSPDGTLLLYAQQWADPGAPDKPRSRLYTCDWDGGRPAPLTAGDESVVEGGGRWSPDGTQVAFAAELEDGFGLYVVPAGGGGPRLVTRHRGEIAAIAWSPDGSLLAYSAPVDPSDPDETGPAPPPGPARTGAWSASWPGRPTPHDSCSGPIPRAATRSIGGSTKATRAHCGR